ncbi:MAG: hypothetical protein ACP5QI_06225 [Candidatus Bathyarchaeia archaeon]
MVDETKSCQPKCQAFRCAKRALTFRQGKAWCRYADDACDVKSCKFAQCIRGKLLPNGICGLSVKQRTVDIRLSDIGEPVKVPGKLARKLRERELF